ncbi:tRNA-splicing endonuclease subunit sen34-related [Anaeramoeba ignava]|uniref:tRNA-splicing endonuclease subunit Sen34 n=1 Tax=Anaeramoeba ignava TaxID=1746090 RepID=A0A9Q0LZ17_ANAIG|nr:tRNA-splicing endonuclease subunit sen34-related [Anaeramoeba ignava]
MNSQDNEIKIKQEKPKIFIFQDNGYVWDLESLKILREKHRILGSFLGTTPQYHSQNEFLVFPVLLMKEELFLCVSNDWVDLFEWEKNGLIKQFENFEEDEFQVKRLKTTSSSLIEIKTTNENKTYSKISKEKIGFFKSKEEKMRAIIFRDLWQRGYFISSGLKFGGDYLLYPNDPGKFHASHIVKVVSSENVLTPKYLISSGRLGTSVNKKVIFASVDFSDENNEKNCFPKYLSFNWAGKM